MLLLEFGVDAAGFGELVFEDDDAAGGVVEAAEKHLPDTEDVCVVAHAVGWIVFVVKFAGLRAGGLVCRNGGLLSLEWTGPGSASTAPTGISFLSTQFRIFAGLMLSSAPTCVLAAILVSPCSANWSRNIRPPVHAARNYISLVHPYPHFW